MMAKLKRMYQSHFLIRSASPSAHARATAEPAFACPGILSQPPFSMTSALCQLLTASSSLSFASWFGCFTNWATQIAAWLAKTASLVIVCVVPEVVQPPHAKPMIIAITAPQIRPQTPYFTFAAVSGFIDTTLLNRDPRYGAIQPLWRYPPSDCPVSQLVHASRHVAGGASGKPWGLCDRCLRVRSHRPFRRETPPP